MVRYSSIIETVAAVAGMLGAALLASALHPGLGFAAFLVSNVGWLVFSAGHGHWRMFAQQGCFCSRACWACGLGGLGHWLG
jgi:hypothetical protein